MTVFGCDEWDVVPKICVPSKENAKASTASHFTARLSVEIAVEARDETSMPPSYALAKTEQHGESAIALGLLSRMMDWDRFGGDSFRS